MKTNLKETAEEEYPEIRQGMESFLVNFMMSAPQEVRDFLLRELLSMDYSRLSDKELQEEFDLAHKDKKELEEIENESL